MSVLFPVGIHGFQQPAYATIISPTEGASRYTLTDRELA